RAASVEINRKPLTFLLETTIKLPFASKPAEQSQFIRPFRRKHELFRRNRQNNRTSSTQNYAAAGCATEYMTVFYSFFKMNR
ncbi:hypothetical protein ABG818_10630, partial [Bifidobacterium adolescentis]